MTVHFIGAGPGAADLLTIRGSKILNSCAVCLYAGSLVPKEILSHCPDGARIINTAPLDLDSIIREIKNADQAGLDVARLHSGDLSVWSAMGEQLRRLRTEGIPVSITPGVPSFAAAAAALGIELTLPGVAQSVVLTRTPGKASAMPKNETLENFAKTEATLAIHLSIHNLATSVKKLTLFYGENCPIAVVFRASCPDQRIIRSDLKNIVRVMPQDIERSALIIVGQALNAESFQESCLYDLNYDRRFRANSTFTSNTSGNT